MPESREETPIFSPAEIQVIQSYGGNAELMMNPLSVCPDMDRAWEGLDWCLDFHRDVEQLSIKIRYAIGKFLIWAKGNPEFFRRKGFRTYSAFISEYVVEHMGFGRSSLYQARKWAESFANVGPAIVEELGATKAVILSNITRDTEPSFPRFLEQARSQTATEFEQWSVQQGLIEAGEFRGATIVFNTNESIANLWQNFVSEAAVKERVGSDQADKIFEAVIQECLYWLGDPERQALCTHCNGTGRESQ